MPAELQLFYTKKPFGVRLTDNEIDFVTENFDDLFDGDREIQPRKAFILLCEKALYKIQKEKTSLPADLQKISSLQNIINELTKDQEELQNRQTEIATQFNDAVTRKINAEKRVEELSERVLQLEQALREKETGSQEPVELVLSATDRLLKLTPLESFVLAQIEKVHACDAKEILINRFFMVYQRRGNGDYDIKRITPSAYAQIESHIKNS
jgi:predicted RNase H-like nuclease (RuvC/YqgF family)